MSKLITDRGEYELLFLSDHVGSDGDILLGIRDARSLAEIVPEFEGLTSLRAEYDLAPAQDYEGYHRLVMIHTLGSPTVQIRLRKVGL